MNFKARFLRLLKLLGISVAGMFAIFVVLGIIAVNSSDESSDKLGSEKTPPPLKQEEINFSINYGFQPGFSVPVFTLKNLNTHEWEDCDLELNKGYERHMEKVMMPESLQSGSHSIASIWFVNEDGLKFDANSYEPRSISVVCRKPYLSVGAYSFR